MEKEIIWTVIDANICAIIPKQRGKGYLKTPYGHHINPGLEDIRTQLDNVDIFGLDGHLEIRIGDKVRYPEQYEALKAKAIRLLEVHYGWPLRESCADFWKYHPIKLGKD